MFYDVALPFCSDPIKERTQEELCGARRLQWLEVDASRHADSDDFAACTRAQCYHDTRLKSSLFS